MIEVMILFKMRIETRMFGSKNLIRFNFLFLIVQKGILEFLRIKMSIVKLVKFKKNWISKG